MNVQAYLERIAVKQKTPPDLGYLTKLQKNHMEKIPFENLDVTRKVEIKLMVDRFFKKVVENRRGGFCYELNGLFQHLLTELGFRAHLISCTVKKPNGWAKENSHAAIIVHLDEPYLVDVGFGDSVRTPLPLTGEKRTDVSGTYRIFQLENGFYELQRFENENWKTLYRFTDAPRQLQDFSEGCVFNQTSPESTFTHGDLATIATPKGRITLSGRTVTRTVNGKKEQWELTEEEKTAFLKEYFQIDI